MKAIFFDFDGVLTVDKYGSDSILRYLAEHTPVSQELLAKEYYRINKGLLYGQYTHKDIWSTYCDRVGYRIDYGVLIESFRHTPLDMEMLAAVRRLKKSYKIGLITDNKVDRIEEILSYHAIKDLFDAVVVSADVKCGKTDRIIFDTALKMLNVEPTDSVFIDNSQKNLLIPAEIGMHTILFDDQNREVSSFERNLMELLQK